MRMPIVPARPCSSPVPESGTTTMTRNRLLFLHKTRAGYRTWAYITSEYLRTFMSWSLRAKWQNKRHLRSIMMQAFRDYSQGRFGQWQTS